VTKVLKLAKPAHAQCPLGSHLTGVETVDSFSVGTALLTDFRPRPGRLSAVRFADLFFFKRWCAALESFPL
jgi:hypothetical protein